MAVVPFLLGPTAVGKTDVSLLIARDLPVEIVSADSRQIYRYLDIGTAKPGRAALKLVRHHFIDDLSPEEYYSAGLFARNARRVIKNILRRNKLPIVVGGSGFYIKALLDGLSEINIVDRQLRSELLSRWQNEGAAVLYRELKNVDPDLAAKIHQSDKQRILRGLEVYLSSGSRLSELQNSSAGPAAFDPLMFGLTARRNILYARINQRVEDMLAAGLVDEVAVLQKKGYGRDLNALNTVGYKEIFSFLAGEISESQMVSDIKKNSRRYAKRQLTWFNKDTRIHWIDIERYQNNLQIAGMILAAYRKAVHAQTGQQPGPENG
jgi:tRNA dimethylallyltransferase